MLSKNINSRGTLVITTVGMPCDFLSMQRNHCTCIIDHASHIIIALFEGSMRQGGSPQCAFCRLYGKTTCASVELSYDGFADFNHGTRG